MLKAWLFSEHCFIAGLQWVGAPCQQRAIAKGQCSVAAKQRGGGKHIAQVKFTYQIHRLNQKREKPLVLFNSQNYIEVNLFFCGGHTYKSERSNPGPYLILFVL